jgi:prepilin-type N-terminal cleavage/methylation domain-containing protein
MRRDRDADEAGFTLIELLIASTAGLILLFVVTGTVMDAFRMANLLKARVALNQEARVAFELLTFGGVQSGINNAPATQDYTFGFLGRRSAGAAGTGWAPPTDLMAKSGAAVRLYQLALSTNDTAPSPAPAGSLLGPLIPSFDIACAGASDPVAGCAASATITMLGRLRDDPAIISDGRLREITLRLIDPYVLGNRFGAIDDAVITFWTVLPLNVDEHPT